MKTYSHEFSFTESHNTHIHSKSSGFPQTLTLRCFSDNKRWQNVYICSYILSCIRVIYGYFIRCRLLGDEFRVLEGWIQTSSGAFCMFWSLNQHAKSTHTTAHYLFKLLPGLQAAASSRPSCSDLNCFVAKRRGIVVISSRYSCCSILKCSFWRKLWQLGRRRELAKCILSFLQIPVCVCET